MNLLKFTEKLFLFLQCSFVYNTWISYGFNMKL